MNERLRQLQARRARLERVLFEVRAELQEIERDIRGLGTDKSIELNQIWFVETVVPILKLAGNSGMTGAKLREELEKTGHKIDAARFRLFLTRQKQRGNIELRPAVRGPGRWVLLGDAH